MRWNKLLTKKRLCLDKSSITPVYKLPNFINDDYMEDYNNIISSASFRRLQDKTQVFPLDNNDFVRTRLTHSLEVSSIASKLGAMLLNSNYCDDEIRSIDKEEIIRALACAGLLHDIGNPPFGHFGEKVIGNWFNENLKKLKFKDDFLIDLLDQQMINDLIYFEGNAQAFRILSKGRFGQQINVTKSVISMLIKYPTSSLRVNQKSGDIRCHKFGYFKAEESLFYDVAYENDIKVNDKIARHPLTFLLEAADDISYITADLEDAYKKGIFKIEELHEFLMNFISNSSYSSKNYARLLFDKLLDISNVYDFRQWILETQMYLINSACYSFIKNYNSIIEGDFDKHLFKDSYHEVTVTALKEAMIKFVFNSKDILVLELSCHTILTFLLEKFVKAAIYFDENIDDHDSLDVYAKYIELISTTYKNDYLSSKKEEYNKNENKASYLLYLRILMVVDYVSSMTDSYASNLYRELSGIKDY